MRRSDIAVFIRHSSFYIRHLKCWLARRRAFRRRRTLVDPEPCASPRKIEKPSISEGSYPFVWHPGKVEFVEGPYEAARGAHAIAIMTEWEMYRLPDWEKIWESMEKPAFVFDGRNILDHARLFEIGFNVYPLGSPLLKHLQNPKRKKATDAQVSTEPFL